MKTVFIGDIHGLDIWKKIIIKEEPQRVIFFGDYFDSFNINPIKQQENVKELLVWKKLTPIETILLIGNHDYHYFAAISDESTSGFQRKQKWNIQAILEENKEHFQMAYGFDNILCTHAGVSLDFMNITFGENDWNVDEIPQLINDLWIYKPRKFMFNGLDPYGDNLYQTPIWIRPRSLINSNKNSAIANKWIQIVGHTVQDDIIENNGYYFIDTLPYKLYLVHENGQFITKNIK